MQAGSEEGAGSHPPDAPQALKESWHLGSTQEGALPFLGAKVNAKSPPFLCQRHALIGERTFLKKELRKNQDIFDDSYH